MVKIDRNIEVVDFLKGYAIVTIVLFHLLQGGFLLPWSEKIVSFGGTGVHTFFLLSGFGLYLSHCRRPLSFLSFLRKRFLKIYLPYIILVIVSAVITMFIPIYQHSTYAIMGHVLLYKMFDDGIIGSYGYHLWFISTILQFYLLFPGLAALKRRLPNWMFLGLGLVISGLWAGIVFALNKGEVRAWYSFFLQYLWEFVLGMLIAEWYHQRGTLKLPSRTALGALAVVGLGTYSLMAVYWGTLGKLLNDIPAMIGYTAVGLFIYRLPVKAVHRALLFTGKISYALYLVHIAIKLSIVHLLHHYGWSVDAPALLGILLVSFLVAYGYHQLTVRMISLIDRGLSQRFTLRVIDMFGVAPIIRTGKKTAKAKLEPTEDKSSRSEELLLIRDLLNHLKKQKMPSVFPEDQQPTSVPSDQKGATHYFKLPLEKRIFDIVTSLSLLIVLFPLFLLVALAIKLETKGPVFYYSLRVGTNYTIFKFWKFRSMRQNADQMMNQVKHLNHYATGEPEVKAAKVTSNEVIKIYNSQASLLVGDDQIIGEHALGSQHAEVGNQFIKIQNDPRITRVGKIIRNTSIDELPQLINVLLGDISLVGNRPLPLYEAEKLTSDQNAQRFMAPAGITGLWQVTERGKKDTSEESRTRLDIEYAENYSFWLDMKILLKTPLAMFQQEDV